MRPLGKNVTQEALTGSFGVIEPKIFNFSDFFIAAKVLTINRRLPPECMRSVHGKKRRFKDKRKRRAKRGDIAAAEMDLQGGLVRGASNGGGRHEQSWTVVTLSSGIQPWTYTKHSRQLPAALDRVTEYGHISTSLGL